MPVTGRRYKPGGFEQPTVRLAVGGGRSWSDLGAHGPAGDLPAAVRHWTGDLAALPAPAPDVLRVLAGDFNATFDHAALRAVLGLGYDDAARAGGGGHGPGGRSGCRSPGSSWTTCWSTRGSRWPPSVRGGAGQ